MRSDSGTGNNAGSGPDSASDPVTTAKPSGSDLAASVPPRHREAGRLVLTAARVESEARSRRGDPLTAIDVNTAERMRQRAEADAPGYMAEVGAGGELIPASIMGENSRALQFADTVQNPNYVTVDASRDRLDLAHEAAALESALDAAESIDAKNSLEKMLAHQLAAGHRSAMKLVAEMNRQAGYLANVHGSEQDRMNMQVTRLAGATARMMTAFQHGLVTLQRLRTGGQQVVTVQHVEVRDGGQAIVAGRMKEGGSGKRTGGGGGKK